MSFGISAGVYSQEIDQSNIIPNIATTSGALVGWSDKGDVDGIRLITNTQQFIQEYGYPDPTSGSYFHYAALAFLEQSNTLYCLRVVNGALYGGIAVADTGNTNLPFSAGRSTSAYADSSLYPNAIFFVTAKDPGTWNNDLTISLTNLSASTYEFDINVYLTDSEGNENLVETFTVSRKHQIDGFGRQQYLEDRINGFSAYINVSDNTGVADTVMPAAQATALAMASGSDGSAPSDGQINTGWDTFANPDEVDVRMLINGGNTSVTVQTKLKTIAEARKDCIAILDVPYSVLTSVTAINNWRSVTQNFNSSYCALYAGWVKIYDQYNDVLVDVPPSGHMGAAYAYNDYAAEVWYAPAGFNRGLLNVLGVTNIFTEGERDSLYAAQINPIQLFRGQGIAIWGQKTMQTKASALDRVNVRRLLITLEKTIAVQLRYFLFEPNNFNTRFRITALLEEFMDRMAAGGAFQTEGGDRGYRVVCDTTNNTPAVIDNNQLYVDVKLKPSRSAEYIMLRTTVTKTGASFDEIVTRNTLI
jgi:hypothetical protein